MKSIVIAVLLALAVPTLVVAAQAPAPPAEARAAAASKLDVNRATASELVKVPGIGERLALAIVELRERRGSFTKIDELLEVRGIGEKNLALFAEHLVVGPPAQQPAGTVASQTK